MSTLGTIRLRRCCRCRLSFDTLQRLQGDPLEVMMTTTIPGQTASRATGLPFKQPNPSMSPANPLRSLLLPQIVVERSEHAASEKVMTVAGFRIAANAAAHQVLGEPHPLAALEAETWYTLWRPRTVSKRSGHVA